MAGKIAVFNCQRSSDLFGRAIDKAMGIPTTAPIKKRQKSKGTGPQLGKAHTTPINPKPHKAAANMSSRLAVDCRNKYADKVYSDLGFEQTDRRAVHLYFPGGPRAGAARG